MTRSIEIADVFGQAVEDHSQAWDDLVSVHSMSFSDGSLRLCSADSERLLELNPWSESQLCTRLGMPVSYFRRCPKELRDLQVNHWLAELRADQHQSDWKIRGKGDTVRAIVSPRYAPLDNLELLQLLSPFVGGRFSITLCTLTDESFHFRVADLSRPREVAPGDGIVAGLHIANSEVGKRALTIDACVYRLVCTNGLVRLVKGRNLLHQRHIGSPHHNLKDRIGEVIVSALQESERSVERMIESASIQVDDMNEVLDRLADQHDFSKSFRESVGIALRAMPPRYQETKYGLINALTDAAKALGPDERYGVEAVAGRLLGTREALIAA